MCQVKLVGHSDIRPVLHCGRDRATYWLKIANFSYPCISMSAYLFGPAFPTQVAGSAFPGLPFSGPLFFGPPFSAHPENRHRQTDRRSDRQLTCHGITALCVAYRAVIKRTCQVKFEISDFPAGCCKVAGSSRDIFAFYQHSAPAHCAEETFQLLHQEMSQSRACVSQNPSAQASAVTFQMCLFRSFQSHWTATQICQSQTKTL